MDFSVFIFIIAILLFVILFILWYTHKSFDQHLKYFIELNRTITFITDQTTILAVNKKGLDFFGFRSLKALLHQTRFLSKLFKEIPEDNTYRTKRIDWVEHINPEQTIQVQVDKKELTYTFNMQVSPIKKDRFLVTLHNISRVMAEKNAITEIAEKDTLTQIYNRSKFNIELSEAIRSAQINHKKFSIILFDVDRFKEVNDKYGHDVGDKVLIQVTSLVKNILRSQDIFARWGGEEFIILVYSDANELANRLRKEIEAFSFQIVKKLTCSFGVSHYHDNDTDTSIIKRADNALYRAKTNGRNMVCDENNG